jgi:hypothetical protein
MGKGKSNKNRLRVRRVVDVPLREVSGICLRRGRNGQMFLIAVGDRVAKIAWFSQPRSDEGRIDWHTSNIAKLSGSMLPKRDSQIEAVCADGLGRVLLLQETPPRVELIDPKALKVVASFDLAVEGRSEIAQAWSDPKGSRGEGAVLLPGGHLLVAKRRSRQRSLSLARQIAVNAGEDGSIVVGKIIDNDTYAYGYDAQEGQYVDLVSKGIIDPTKVVRATLQGAASVAGLMMTTEAMVAEKPKKEMPSMPGMPPGGGMDY